MGGLELFGLTPDQAVVLVMQLMYNRGLIQVRGGNVSVRVEENVYISPSGVPRPLLRPEHVAILDLNGKVIRGNPSSEWRMQLEIYRNIPDATAVVHAHPKAVLTATYRGLEIDPRLLSEAGLRISCIGRVPWITPGTEELARAVAREAAQCNAIILDGHGATVWSKSGPFHALDMLEALEDLAWILLNIE